MPEKRCQAMKNTHLAMGWSCCGKPATKTVKVASNDWDLCDECYTANGWSDKESGMSQNK